MSPCKGGYAAASYKSATRGSFPVIIGQEERRKILQITGEGDVHK